MKDSFATPNIPITREIDGFTFVNQTIHKDLVNKLEREIARLREVLESMQDDAINDDSLNYTAKWIKRARQALKGDEE